MGHSPRPQGFPLAVHTRATWLLSHLPFGQGQMGTLWTKARGPFCQTPPMLYAAVVFVVVCLSLCLPELCSVTVFVFCGLNLEPESCGKPGDASEPWLPQTLGCSSYSSPMYLYIYMSFCQGFNKPNHRSIYSQQVLMLLGGLDTFHLNTCPLLKTQVPTPPQNSTKTCTLTYAQFKPPQPNPSFFIQQRVCQAAPMLLMGCLVLVILLSKITMHYC